VFKLFACGTHVKRLEARGSGASSTSWRRTPSLLVTFDAEAIFFDLVGLELDLGA